ncbi:hypothetical protein ACLK1S_14490 [Escherichia coli]
MQKRKGFRRENREMLCGVMEQTDRSPAPRRGLTARAAANGKQRSGGGIATRLSLALLRRGWQVTL